MSNRMSRAAGGSPDITEHMAALIKGMLARGDSHASIAAFFGVNMGRVADIKARRRFHHVQAAAPVDLPPPPPLLTPYEFWMAERAKLNANLSKMYYGFKNEIPKFLEKEKTWT